MPFVNLSEFYTVQLCTGHDCKIFPTYDAAQKAAAEWDAAIVSEYENGNMQYAKSTIDCDGISYSINSVFLSGGIRKHEVGQASHSLWADHPDAHKIKWGNPATQRAKKPAFA